MKDYSMLDGMIEEHKEHLKTAYDKGYKQGCEDGFIKGTSALKEIQDCNKVTTIAEQYFRGLNDAWECVRKLIEFKISELKDMFDTCSIGTVLANFTAQEVMAKMNKGDKIDPKFTMTLTELKASYEDMTCNTCRHDGFICDECENHSMYEPRPIKEKSCKECQILEDEYCKYPDLKCSECPVKKKTSMGKMNNLQDFFDAQSKVITNLTSRPIECGCQQGAELLPQYKDIKHTESKGHWILIDKELSRYKCSECGEVIRLYKKNEISNLEKDETLSDYPFSHCGAKMFEPQEREGINDEK